MEQLSTIDDPTRQRRRFKTALLCGVAIMLIFCAVSLLEVLASVTVVSVLSLFSDVAFTALLLAMFLLLPRLPLNIVALTAAVGVLVYSLANVLYFPEQLLRSVLQPLLAVTITVSYVNTSELRVLSVAAWVTMVFLFLISARGLPAGAALINFIAVCGLAAIVLLMLNQFHARMHEALLETRGTNAALRDVQTGLETVVAERTATLEQTLSELRVQSAEQARLLAETEAQRTTIRALSVPILPVGAATIAIPLVGVFDAPRLATLQEQALRAIEQSHVRCVVIDVTGVTAIDHEVADGLLQIANATKLLGARVVLVGVGPEVAQTIVGIGASMASMRTAATLQEGIALAARL